MPRVLATDEAKDALTKFKGLVQGDLETLVSQLDAQGQKLSNPNVWDGPKAIDFRNLWPDTHRALKTAKEKLDTLRQSMDQITSEIMRAGGGAG
jgi:uncharacterized protein YukE